jgi:hypothetical protein
MLTEMRVVRMVLEQPTEPKSLGFGEDTFQVLNVRVTQPLSPVDLLLHGEDCWNFAVFQTL